MSKSNNGLIKLNDLEKIGKMLVGAWKGKIGEDIVDEYWSIALGNSILGMFRWIKEGKANFYELVVIDDYDGVIKMRIKHFNAAFSGWEKKDDFVYYILHEVNDTKIIFGSEDPTVTEKLIYLRPSETKLQAILEMKDQVLKFSFDKI